MNTEDVLTGAVDRPHGRLQYAVSGRNHGQAVLLLHPLGSDLAFWQPQLKTLGLRFRVIRFDARGHGGSVIAAGAPLACTMTDLLDDACAVLDELARRGLRYGLCTACVGAGMGIGRIGGSAVEGMARQPEAAGRIQTAALILAALIEGAALFGVVIGFQIQGKITF